MLGTEARSCDGKRRYVTRKGAKSRAHRVSKLTGLRAYKCDFCEFWHLGHSSARGRAALRALKSPHAG